jgi:serine/threonine protein kinase
MLDWAKIAAKVEYALTLEGEALTSFLSSFEGTQEQIHIQRLLERAQHATGFLATSASEHACNEELLELGTLIGSWKIMQHLGRGGMGEVYKACRADGLYEQTVALKLIQGMSESRAALFEVERRRLALMNHPGIARIIDGGTSDDGRPYMAMEFVDGVAIDDYVAKHQLDLDAKLQLFISVCKSVAHAHGQLVLHRDIKPQNVLVDEQSNTRLIDFGIASTLDDDIAGTGAFSLATAAPEQLKGEVASVQTDVFSLGLLLHEMLIGKRPTRLESGGMQADSSANMSPDLLAIVNKAIALEPENRYGSVSSMCDDISAFLSCHPVSAREGGRFYRTVKFIKRYPIANAFALIALLSLTGGLASSINFAQHAQSEAERANVALSESQVNLERARFFLSRADLFHATQSAYADTLQSMFGGEADVDRQTKILKERWQQAYDLRNDDPNTAAFLSYAIGRHFLFRNDYLTAMEILQAWVTDEYGPTELLGYARQLLAVTYSAVGREADALPLLRQTEKWLASSFEAASPDHIAAATQIANISRAEEDVLAAEALLLKGLEVEQNDQIRMYFWNQTSKMRQIRGDFAAAYQAMKEVVNIIDAKPLLEISGTDTGLLNLANFELWHTQDLNAAQTLADRVIQTAFDNKGESRELGIAYSVKAKIHMISGEAEQALLLSGKARELAEKYSSVDSNTTILININHAEILASLGRPNAKGLIGELSEQINGLKKSANMHQRVLLAEALVTLHLDGVDAAKQRYLSLPIDSKLISKDLELSYIHQKLAAVDVAPKNKA